MVKIRVAARLVVVLAIGLGRHVHAELFEVPTLERFLRRGHARATVLENYLYIEGGLLAQSGTNGERTKEYAVNTTLSIDLSSSWTTQNVKINSIAKIAPKKFNVNLWTDKTAGVFYSWGGTWLGGFNMSETALWMFTPDQRGAGAWSPVPIAFAEHYSEKLRPTEKGAFASTEDTGVLISGETGAWTEKGRVSSQAVPGMLTFDMKTRTFKNWTVDDSPHPTLHGGSAHFIPSFGPNGLIMTFGGVVLPVDQSPPNYNASPARDLGNLTFFDPKTKTKYWQVATGDIPRTPRESFGLAGFATKDGGYEIFLYGGVNEREEIVYGDAFILSLPGFVWTRVPRSPGGPRKKHELVSVGKRQVLSIGGTENSWTQKDDLPNGLVLFDMSEMAWKDSYDANAADYVRADAIAAWYKNGSLDAVDWSSSAVKSLFLNGTGGSASPFPTTESTNPSSGGVSVAAIAGGVVGGLVGLGIIVAAVWWFIRRRRQINPAVPDEYESGGDKHMYTNVPPSIRSITPPKSRHSPAISEAPAEHTYAELPTTTGVAELHAQHGKALSPVDQAALPVELDAGDHGRRW